MFDLFDYQVCETSLGSLRPVELRTGAGDVFEESNHVYGLTETSAGNDGNTY